MNHSLFKKVSKKGLILSAIVLFAIIVRLVYWQAAAQHHGDNFLKEIALDGYYQMGEYFAQGNDMPADNVNSSMRTPGLPLLLSPFIATNTINWYLVIQIIIGGCLPLAGFWIARELGADNALGYMVASAMAIEPMSVMLATQLMTETIFLAFFLPFTALLLRSMRVKPSLRDIFTLGLLLGLSVIVRPSPYLLPIIIIPLLFIRWRSHCTRQNMALGILIALLAFSAPLVPWMMRNHSVYGTFSLTSAGPQLAFIALAPSVVALDTNMSYQAAQERLFEQYGLAMQPEINHENARRYSHATRDVLFAHPKGVILSMAGTAFQLFTHDGVLTAAQHIGFLTNFTTENLETPPLFVMVTNPQLDYIPHLVRYITGPAGIVVISRLAWIGIAFLAALGMGIYWRHKKNRHGELAAAIIIIGYFLLTSLVVGIGLTARLRQPLNPFFFFFALYFMQRATQWLYRRTTHFLTQRRIMDIV